MNAPIITIIDISKPKISDEDGFKDSDFTFVCDKNIINFEARANSTSRLDGIVLEDIKLIHCSSDLACSDELAAVGFYALAGEPVTGNIHFTELTMGDGIYDVSIYVQTEDDGLWY